jgi:hypothetical protein
LNRWTLSLLTVAAACGDSSDPAVDASAGGPDAATADAGPAVDGAGPDASPSAACDDDDAVLGTIGAAGGEIEHPGGAALRVRPGTLDRDVVFSICRISEPGGVVPLEHELVGDAFQFAPADVELAALVAVVVPRERDVGGYLFPVWLDGDVWQRFEGCTADDTSVEAHVSWLGTFAALQDTVVFTERGGTGTLAAEIDGEPHAFDVDAKSSDFAVYEVYDGGRAIDITADAPLPDGFHRLRLRFSIDARGALVGEPLVDLVTYTGGRFQFWSYYPGLHAGDGVALALDSADGDAITGTFAGAVYATPEDTIGRALTAGELDVVVEDWRWPPELVCDPELVPAR